MANTFGPDTVKLYSNDITFILHHFVQYTRTNNCDGSLGYTSKTDKKCASVCGEEFNI